MFFAIRNRRSFIGNATVWSGFGSFSRIGYQAVKCLYIFIAKVKSPLIYIDTLKEKGYKTSYLWVRNELFAAAHLYNKMGLY